MARWTTTLLAACAGTTCAALTWLALSNLEKPTAEQWFGPASVPGWLQAVGSLAAILAVYGVSWGERRERREQAALHARLAARTSRMMLMTVAYRLSEVLGKEVERPEAGVGQSSTDLVGQLKRLDTVLASPWPQADDCARLVELSADGAGELSDRMFAARLLLERAAESALAPTPNDAGTHQAKATAIARSIAAAQRHLSRCVELLIQLAGDKSFDEVLIEVQDGRPKSTRRSEWERARRPMQRLKAWLGRLLSRDLPRK